MRLLPVFLAQSALAADTSPEKALSTCKEFFGEDATSSRLGEGEQAVVYKCENSTLISALKIYKKPHELVGEPELRIKVDRAVGDAGNGPAFYGSKTDGFPINYEECGNFDNCEPGIPDAEYVNCGNFDACGDNLFYAKFEEFLSGKNVDVKDLHKPETYIAVATRLAELHQMTKEEVDIPIKFCSEPWPWNTNAIRVHLSNPLFEKGLEYIDDSFKKDPIEDEKASFTCLKDIYDFAVQNVEMSNSPVVMTHQDVHAGNIFLKNGGEDDTLLDRLMLTDYDNAGFGPRAWDLLYYFFNWQRIGFVLTL